LWLLRANNLGVRILDAQRFGWIGLFCSNAMPDSVSGDLIKAIYLRDPDGITVVLIQQS